MQAFAKTEDTALDYPLENLGPERFQEFCQALLLTEYPRIQCFPVGQPDGGRDAVSYYPPDESGKFIVFQVKFMRKPLAENDPHNWLVEVISRELPKINELKRRGAEQYILITNVPGTAHLDSGSIDKLNELLTRETGIASTGWWRNDINRRLDTNWAIKWTYPEIMTGPDLIRAIIDSGNLDGNERRTSAIRAFVRAQHDAEEDVRFKQVDLQNRLFDLFIDVPISLQKDHAGREQIYAYEMACSRNGRYALSEAHQDLLEHQLYRTTQHQPMIGAAELLMHIPAKPHLSRVVIEGAPGQGKSTITQYVCQMYRTQLLKNRQTSALNDVGTIQSVMLPVRVDLRDLATWLAKRDPFNPQNANEVPVGWHRTLEAFLAALIRETSGGISFSPDDLIAVLKRSSVFLVFDGLDEVADITKRQEIVEEITKGVQRLEENAASIQVIVTSRPAAFANSPGMPSSKYTYLQLKSLSKVSILEYADKWLRVKKLESRQQTEFKQILNAKLDQPHLRDLARNPMQLAILLSLILTRGSSLPDKRTALYDYYIDLFFSREAEKSVVVRDHRQLLIDFHGYLAWLLHGEAEIGQAQPSISQDRLREQLEMYLIAEGHDINLARSLFDGMVERVVAIVSRVQGTYEFEVQPLREYFAAYHLYDTAPPSSTGKESSGAKPDRFDALARNFYWLNVTRFFAGFYSKGELPSLIQRLEALAESPNFKLIGQPLLLTLTLLSDWVFHQNPRSIREAISLVCDPNRLRLLTAGRRNGGPAGYDAFTLPPKCGREELVAAGLALLGRPLQRDFVSEIVAVLNVNNDGPADVRIPWLQILGTLSNPAERRRWIERGFELGLIGSISLADLQQLLPIELGGEMVPLLFQSERFDYLALSNKLFDEGVSYVLNLPITYGFSDNANFALVKVGRALDVHILSFCFRTKGPTPFREQLAHLFSHVSADAGIDSPDVLNYENARKCSDLAETLEAELNRTSMEWASTLAPWTRICEHGRLLFGDRPAILQFANVAAGIHSLTEQYKEFRDLLDHAKPLCERVRYARLRSGQHSWWKAQFAIVKSDFDRELILLVLLSWASDKTLLHLAKELDVQLAKLSVETWERLVVQVRYVPSRDIDSPNEGLDPREIPNGLSNRTATALARRITKAWSKPFFETYFSSVSGLESVSLEFVLAGALDLPNIGTKSWSPDLALIRDVYRAGRVTEPRGMSRAFSPREIEHCPIVVAENILGHPLEYPGFLVALAEAKYRATIAKSVAPVSSVAIHDRWFAQAE